MTAQTEQTSLAGDLLRGAGAIAAELGINLRQVYHLATEVKPEQRLPVFRLGSLLCARKSTLLAWIAAQEGVN